MTAGATKASTGQGDDMPRAKKQEATAEVTTPPARAARPKTAGQGVGATRSSAGRKTTDGKTTGGRTTGSRADASGERGISEEHLEAIRSGRNEARIVRSYLEALEKHRPRRGPRRTPEKLRARLEKIEHDLVDADVFDRLALHQEKLDLEAEIRQLEGESDLPELQKRFIGVAASYSARRGISTQAWLAVGVPRSVLDEAGVRD
jgi:hypothetical protein